MTASRAERKVTVDALADYPNRIDVRSPAEFAEDHLPGAVNWPVLDDEQRRIVGTLYKQVSTLQARKVGAAMVARNIADHLDRWVADPDPCVVTHPAVLQRNIEIYSDQYTPIRDGEGR